ncbi:MAG: hypothetical protein CMM01_08560 [Rhodopirellula sp.]|nr:hypothetical protein [Rhodopirellula sp.]
MKPSTARPGALSVGQVLRFEKPDGNSVCSAAGGLSRVGRSISRACEQARDQGNAELSSLGSTVLLGPPSIHSALMRKSEMNQSNWLLVP